MNRHFRSFMQHYMFNRSINPRFSMTESDIDNTKPVRMEVGKDSFASIRQAPDNRNTARGAINGRIIQTGVEELDQWQAALLDSDLQDASKSYDIGNDVPDVDRLRHTLYEEYGENDVDNMRRQKDEELETLRHERRRPPRNTRNVVS